ncbi:MAG: hypothetical protein MR278_01835 [Bacteroidales bacterium]|nr:hypothetical protein [Anaerotignum sp.]MCI5678716.1 hypothetical protein [Bacteroidales bacterium]MDY3925924.1 hypothetical protein [Anaerotignum sp.]
MKCDKCGMEAIISDKQLGFEGDESPDTETKAYHALTYSCRNRHCENFEKEVGTEKVYLD